MTKNKLFKKYKLFIIIGVLIVAAIFIFPKLNSEGGAHKELTGTGLSMTYYDENGKVIGTDVATPASSVNI